MRTGFFRMVGSFLRVNVPGFSTLENTAMRKTRAIIAMTAMKTNVILHPRANPMILPSGSPTIIAIDVPAATALMASFLYSMGTTATARGVAMDQNMEWDTATPRRETMSIP